jgi:hypothetical protein
MQHTKESIFPKSRMTARHRFRTFCGSLLALWLACAMHPGKALCEAITPFQTQNQSPTALIFGLPAAGDATILGQREFGGILALDIANNFAQSANSREQILLDGESYRANLGISYGFAKGFEAGIEIPFIGIGGGIFDSFIKGGTGFSGCPQGRCPKRPITGFSIPTKRTARPCCCSMIPVRALAISAFREESSSTTTNSRTRDSSPCAPA